LTSIGIWQHKNKTRHCAFRLERPISAAYRTAVRLIVGWREREGTHVDACRCMWSWRLSHSELGKHRLWGLVLRRRQSHHLHFPTTTADPLWTSNALRYMLQLTRQRHLMCEVVRLSVLSAGDQYTWPSHNNQSFTPPPDFSIASITIQSRTCTRCA
jgi:hypothetical protein